MAVFITWKTAVNKKVNPHRLTGKILPNVQRRKQLWHLTHLHKYMANSRYSQ